MLDLKQKNDKITNPVAVSELLCLTEGSDLRVCELIRSDGKNFLHTVTDSEDQVDEFDQPVVPFVESGLLLEGSPEPAGISLKLSEDAMWILWALGDLKKRIYLKSLLDGSGEINLLAAPEEALRGVAEDAFAKNEDYRMPMGFLQLYLGKTYSPDLDKAFRELKEKGLVLEDGALSIGGAVIVTSLSFIHAALGVKHVEEKDGTPLATGAVYLNCYHSIWLMCPPAETDEFLICSIGREEFQTDLEEIYAEFR